MKVLAKFPSNHGHRKKSTVIVLEESELKLIKEMINRRPEWLKKGTPLENARKALQFGFKRN